MNLNITSRFLFYVVLVFSIILSQISAEESTVCDGQVFKATCPTGQFLVIDSAHYGRTDTSTCLADGATTESRLCKPLKSTLSTLNRHCYRRNECNITVTEEHLGNPCKDDVSKYLDVVYQCVTEEDVAEICSKYMIKLEGRASGYIHSRNYPNFYEPNDDCVVKVKARDGFRYQFQLLDLDVEQRRGTGCYDLLVAKDEQSAALTFNYCGTLDDIHTSESDTAQNIQDLAVTFRSDPMTNRKGFLLKYQEHEVIMTREEL